MVEGWLRRGKSAPLRSLGLRPQCFVSVVANINNTRCFPAEGEIMTIDVDTPPTPYFTNTHYLFLSSRSSDLVVDATRTLISRDNSEDSRLRRPYPPDILPTQTDARLEFLINDYSCTDTDSIRAAEHEPTEWETEEQAYSR
jgi:hypothetical protein